MRRGWQLVAVAMLLCAAPARAATGPALSVGATTGLHPISPMIYGINGAHQFQNSALANSVTVDRLGGDLEDSYNWQLSGTNNGLDWYHENIADCSPGCTPFWQTFVNQDRGTPSHPATLLDLPMMGYVPRDVETGPPRTCNYRRTVFAVQDDFDPWDASCGIGTNSGQAAAQSFDGSSWSPRTVPAPTVPGTCGSCTQASWLAAVSCPSASACIAVGDSAANPAAVGPGPHLPAAEHWNGSSWALQSVPAPSGAAQTLLNGVSCATASSCTAVGEYRTATGGWLGLAERWNGASWSAAAVPSPTGALYTVLTGVSCPPSSTTCIAVGAYWAPAAHWTAFVAQSSATGWTVQSPPPPTGATWSALSGVSCSAATTCTAVGAYGGGPAGTAPLVDRWAAGGWSLQSTPSRGTPASLAAVSCPAAATCMAVGYDHSSGNGQSEPLAERWTSAGWAVTNPVSPGPGGALTSVSCPSATACTTVGRYYSTEDLNSNPWTWSVSTTAEHWNGSAWTAQSSANVNTDLRNALDGVSCPSASACRAVGDHTSSSDGTVELPGTPSFDSVSINPASYASAWIAKLKSLYGTAASGGVPIYELGNEPTLWGNTHANDHPFPESAKELISKSLATADAVKTADTSAKVVGFSDWGWSAYFCSGADDSTGTTCGFNCNTTSCSYACSTSPDCANHGHIPMAEWYLQQFQQHDQSTHMRHLDYFDVHYYPVTYCYAGQGGGFGCPTPAPAATDVTRSLWDPTYPDPGYIGYPWGFNQGPTLPIQLLPRMHTWVSGPLAPVTGGCPTTGCYPGTKLAITEYNLSDSSSDVVNALIEADALGIFARQQLDLATWFSLGNGEGLIGDAFRLYRNYDGKGAKFGDTWISSTSSNQSQLAVYGAHRTSDGAYTIVVLNKTSGALTSKLTLTGITSSAGSAQTWQWTGHGIVAAAPAPIAGGAITATYPASSMTMYVVK